MSARHQFLLFVFFFPITNLVFGISGKILALFGFFKATDFGVYIVVGVVFLFVWSLTIFLWCTRAFDKEAKLKGLKDRSDLTDEQIDEVFKSVMLGKRN